MTINDVQHGISIDPDHIDAPIESLLTLIVHTTKKMGAAVADTVGQKGLTLDEWMVLDAIHRHDGVAMTQVSAASGCQGATLTRAVDKLVNNALVYREASPLDRRKVIVFISELGRMKHAEVAAKLAGLEGSAAQVLEEVGLSLQEFAVLMRGLAGAEG